MKVLEFAFGFPPRLAAIRHAGIDYSINAIPFGGFVRILGQDDFTIHQAGEGDPGSFTSKPWWAQAIVLAAGVTMNMLLALVVLTLAFTTGTTASTGDVRVNQVAPDSPAQAAGIQVGDIVRSIDGRQITAVPRTEPPEGEGPLGIRLEEVQGAKTYALPDAFREAVSLSGQVVLQIAELPGQLLAPRTSTGGPTVGGPIEIFRITGQVAQSGIPTFLKLVGVLSVNLAVLNIVPFPGLDGGRLFFVLLRGIFRVRLSPQAEAAVHAVGFVLLLLLLVVVSIADIRRVVGG